MADTGGRQVTGDQGEPEEDQQLRGERRQREDQRRLDV